MRKLAAVPLKKRKASDICSWEKCKTKESLTPFRHPVGTILLCRPHVMELEPGEAQYVITQQAQKPPKISDDGRWYLDETTMTWKPYVPPPATPAGTVVPPQPAPAPPPAPSAPTPDPYLSGIMARVPVATEPAAPGYALGSTAGMQIPSPAALDVVPTVSVTGGFDPAILAEIAAAHADASDILALAKALHIRSNEDLLLAAEVIADAKGKYNRLEALKQQVVKPLRALEAEWREKFSSTQDPLAEIESVMKGKVEAFHVSMGQSERQALAVIESSGTAAQVSAGLTQLQQSQVASVPGLTISEVWEYEILDIDQVPGIYVEKKINGKLVKDNARQAEALRTTLTIPGLRLFKKPKAASKAK